MSSALSGVAFAHEGAAGVRTETRAAVRIPYAADRAAGQTAGQGAWTAADTAAYSAPAVGALAPFAPTTRAAAAAMRPAADIGRWSAPVDWPVLAVHATLLPTGDVLAWDATPDDFDEDAHTTDNYTTRVTLWDPDTDEHTSVWNDTGADLFCAGSAHLWDGRIVFAGGDSGRAGRNGPLANSNMFDPWTKQWTETDYLEAPRWYSSVAGLPNGELLTFGGTYSPRPLAEVFRHNKQWRALPITAPFTVSGDYAWLQATSDGDVAYLGPDASLGMLSTEGDGAWSALGQRDADGYRSYGSYAMYDTDRVLISGGGDSLASAVVVELENGRSVPTTSMNHGRRQHNLTILADGQVLATGGNSSGAQFVDPDADVPVAEIWNPATGAWSDAASMPTARQYHSVAMLLPDGRVLTAGGGYCAICGDIGYLEQNAEIFSPPYLFQDVAGPNLVPVAAQRPVITRVPEHVGYASGFTVGTPAAARIAKVHAIKLGSVTHSQNQDQRLIPLDFTAVGDTLRIESPADRNIAPPGHYMLFIVDDAGVPSVAPIMQIGQPLITSDEVVVNRVRADHWDRFELRGEGEHVLTVRLQGDVRDVELYVNANRQPDDLGAVSGAQPAFDCRASEAQAGGKLCTVAGATGTDWFIGVRGRVDADYALVAHVEAGLPVNGTGVPSAGFGRLPGAPSTPMNARSAILSSSSVELAWDVANDDGGIVGYEIHRDGKLLRVQEGTSLIEHSLKPATPYQYRIVAVDDQQNRSAPSDIVIATTLPYEGQDLDELYHPDIPSTPTGVRSVVYSETSAEIFWEPSFDGGFIVGYEIHRNGQLIELLDATSYYDGSLVPGTGYEYYVVAVDNERNRSLVSNVTGVNLQPATEQPIDPTPGPDAVDPDGNGNGNGGNEGGNGGDGNEGGNGDGPVEGPIDGPVDGPVDGPIVVPGERPDTGPVDGPVTGPVTVPGKGPGKPPRDDGPVAQGPDDADADAPRRSGGGGGGAPSPLMPLVLLAMIGLRRKAPSRR